MTAIDETLHTWLGLNQYLKTLTTEEECRQLLDRAIELDSPITFKRRIHSRLNKLRAEREREELK